MTVLRQDEIKYDGKVVFERLEIAKNFKRAPKLFFEDDGYTGHIVPPKPGMFCH